MGYTYSAQLRLRYGRQLRHQSRSDLLASAQTQKLDWAFSQLNLDNQFTASVIYDLPFGKGKEFGSNWGGPANVIFGNWQVNVIQKITSGFPLFVVNSDNGSGVFFLITETA